MSTSMWITLILLTIAIVLFITEWLRVDLVAFFVVVLLMLTGVLSSEEALSGFSNPAVLTIAALFVVGGGVLQTGLADWMGRRILIIAGNKPWAITLVLMTAVAMLSSFLSDTGTVAVLLPATLALARKTKINPSKLLIPLSYGALLGGATTLIGTTPNLIVTELLVENGLPPFTFFNFTPIGLILLIAGAIFMVILGRHLLPDRKPVIDSQPVSNPSELLELYRLPDDLYKLRIRSASPLIGTSLGESQLGELYRINVVEIVRQQTVRHPSSLLHLISPLRSPKEEPQVFMPKTSIRIEVDDVLIVKAQIDQVSKAAVDLRLGVQPVNPDEEDTLINQEIGVAEVLLPPRSTIIGKTIVEIGFGTNYRLNVLGLNRPGNKETLDTKNTTLRFGDILLVQGPWKNILALRKQWRDFVILGQPDSTYQAIRTDKAVIAMAVVLAMLVMLITGVVPITTASMLSALLIVLTGCLKMDEAYQSIDWKAIILIAGMLPMSLALEKTGLVSIVANTFTVQFGGLGPMAVLAGIYLLTSLFTQVLSNTATAVLMAPIALAASGELGINPHAFLMAVAIAASMAFCTPVASPVNTLVMGAGDYHFGDYIKIGLPMIIIVLVLSVLVLPLLFPFYH